jgi:hypothetical protein
MSNRVSAHRLRGPVIVIDWHIPRGLTVTCLWDLHTRGSRAHRREGLAVPGEPDGRDGQVDHEPDDQPNDTAEKQVRAEKKSWARVPGEDRRRDPEGDGEDNADEQAVQAAARQFDALNLCAILFILMSSSYSSRTW